ncbi:DUF3006 domain-containing protein [Haloarcula sp. S1AR25-5A]|uniref:DUF3006 domain-containing protein n=1 Tax=Haloarcula terrestris TaxID=2950533 RepID=A0AAE4F2K9_9EURY|nr:DUF3006 family protein [Haloarcula terrestris]MDS0223742.1 DUF3006 domain-containing protein [Haloarcula terrestris]
MTDLDEVADGEYTAVVDSIEDGLATVFFEQDGAEVGHAVIDTTELPDDARHANAILSVTLAGEELTETDYDPERTETRQDAAQDRFDRLSSRPPTEDDG